MKHKLQNITKLKTEGINEKQSKITHLERASQPEPDKPETQLRNQAVLFIFCLKTTDNDRPFFSRLAGERGWVVIS
jgi:hypothetical protein